MWQKLITQTDTSIIKNFKSKYQSFEGKQSHACFTKGNTWKELCSKSNQKWQATTFIGETTLLSYLSILEHLVRNKLYLKSGSFA